MLAVLCVVLVLLVVGLDRKRRYIQDLEAQGWSVGQAPEAPIWLEANSERAAEWYITLFGDVVGVSIPSAASVSRAEFAWIADRSALKGLHDRSGSIGDADLKKLRGLTGLVSLELSGLSITDRAMAQLPRFKNLLYLYLHDTAVTDAGAAQLSKLVHLRHLNVNSAPITDAGLERLALSRFTGLRSLILSGTGITGAGLEPLKKCLALAVLVIDETQLTDAAIEHIDAMGWLSRLVVEDVSGISADVDKARRRLPWLKIDVRP